MKTSSRLIIRIFVIVVFAYVVTFVADILVTSPRSHKTACSEWQSNSPTDEASVDVLFSCSQFKWHGFPIRSEFCSIKAEQGCTYPNKDDREPIYIFGNVPPDSLSRFQINYIFWVMITGILSVPTSSLIARLIFKTRNQKR